MAASKPQPGDYIGNNYRIRPFTEKLADGTIVEHR